MLNKQGLARAQQEDSSPQLCSVIGKHRRLTSERKAEKEHKRALPGRLLPLLHVSIFEGELIQLGEQVVGDVLLVVVLGAEDELDPLRRRVCGDTNASARRRRTAGPCLFILVQT